MVVRSRTNALHEVEDDEEAQRTKPWKTTILVRRRTNVVRGTTARSCGGRKQRRTRSPVDRSGSFGDTRLDGRAPQQMVPGERVVKTDVGDPSALMRRFRSFGRERAHPNRPTTHVVALFVRRKVRQEGSSAHRWKRVSVRHSLGADLVLGTRPRPPFARLHAIAAFVLAREETKQTQRRVASHVDVSHVTRGGAAEPTSPTARSLSTEIAHRPKRTGRPFLDKRRIVGSRSSAPSVLPSSGWGDPPRTALFGSFRRPPFFLPSFFSFLPCLAEDGFLPLSFRGQSGASFLFQPDRSGFVERCEVGWDVAFQLAVPPTCVSAQVQDHRVVLRQRTHKLATHAIVRQEAAQLGGRPPTHPRVQVDVGGRDATWTP